MSDTPTKTYPPECLCAMIADHEAEQAGATSEESSAVETKLHAMSETAHKTTETQGTVTVSDHVVKHWHRRERYLGAIVALRDTLAHLQGGQTVSTKQMRDSVVELLDALLDMETDGGTR